MQKKYVWDALEPEAMPTVAGSLFRRYVSGREITVGRFQFGEGTVTAEHRHENEQFSLVLEGSMEFTVDGEPIVVNAGEMVYLPANVLHGARALKPSILLDVFSPPRADWETPR